MGLFSGFMESFNNPEKVGGSGLFKNMSQGQLNGASTIANVVGGIEDKFNQASDLKARAALAPSEALLRNKVELPSNVNQTRQFVGNLLAQDRQMQNVAESKDALDRQKRLEQYQIDMNKSILDAINRNK